MMMKGLVFKREVEGVISEMRNAKVAVYSCPYDAQATETKVGKQLANDHHGNQPLCSTVMQFSVAMEICCMHLCYPVCCNQSSDWLTE